MALFELRCTKCGCTGLDVHFTPIGHLSRKPCPNCYGPMQRIASTFGFHPGIPEHFNSTTGTYVKSQRQFNDDLNRAADRQSEITGMEHEYAPVDLGDPVACGVQDPDGSGEPGEHHDRRRAAGVEGGWE